MITSCPISSIDFAQTTENRTVAVTLPVVTLLDIEPTGTITLNFAAPTEAGQPVTVPASNNTKWINYTSAIASRELTTRITASVNQVIPCLNITVQAAADSGSGGGTLGTAGIK